MQSLRCHAWGYGYAAMGLIKIDSYLWQLVLPSVSDSDLCPKTEKNFFDYFLFEGEVDLFFSFARITKYIKFQFFNFNILEIKSRFEK
jgi:hypothetical protein